MEAQGTKGVLQIEPLSREAAEAAADRANDAIYGQRDGETAVMQP